MITLIDQFGLEAVLASGGLFIGLCFGFFAQRSRFCLRAGVIEITVPACHDRYAALSLRGLALVLSLGAVLGCGGEPKTDCPDPVTQTSETMTETEKKLARLKTGFDPNCK
jgi:hypothetical protein